MNSNNCSLLGEVWNRLDSSAPAPKSQKIPVQIRSGDKNHTTTAFASTWRVSSGNPTESKAVSDIGAKGYSANLNKVM